MTHQNNIMKMFITIWILVICSIIYLCFRCTSREVKNRKISPLQLRSYLDSSGRYTDKAVIEDDLHLSNLYLDTSTFYLMKADSIFLTLYGKHSIDTVPFQKGVNNAIRFLKSRGYPGGKIIVISKIPHARP